MSEDKPWVPKLEMPKLSREFLEGFAVTMAEFGKLCREFVEATAAALPAIKARMDAAVKAVQPPSQKVSDKSA